MSESVHIVLGISGSIAAYKSADLVRKMSERSWAVSVMMTQAATKYVGPLTFQALTGREVAYGRFEDLPSAVFQHIDLARHADAILIAPCTANVLAKLAHGFADDVLTSTVLACDKPVIVAPAMNTKMWENAATRDNVALLKERGVHVLDVGEGDLACGEVGAGRLLEVERIIGAVEAILSG